MPVSDASLLFLAAAGAGMINAVAGGGTVVTFSSLLAVGLDPIAANATSTVSLWPGSLGGAWGYRQELARSRDWLFVLIVPSLFGGAIGAELLLRTSPETFRHIVPYLVFFASLLILFHERLSGLVRRQSVIGASSGRPHVAAVIFFQTLVACYGGYFGAGIGILMLACFSLVRIGDMHAMNALKTVLALCINGVATARFAISGRVDWVCAAVMIAGALAGGYLGARFAIRIGARRVRIIVVGIGLALTVHLFLK